MKYGEFLPDQVTYDNDHLNMDAYTQTFWAMLRRYLDDDISKMTCQKWYVLFCTL